MLRLFLLLACALPVYGASGLSLPPPQAFGSVPAAVYDAGGRRIGDAGLAIRREAGGRVSFAVEIRVPGEGASEVYAELEPDGDGRLRPVLQRSRTLDADGALVVGMRVDHGARQAECTDREGTVRTLQLPAADRIANVPMNLLLLPVARGEVEQVRFDLLLCRGEPRLLETVARVAGREEIAGEPVAVLGYRFELGPLLSWLAQAFVPDMRLWLRSDDSGAWLGHRMPLYPKGPEVTVLRDPLRPEQFLP